MSQHNPRPSEAQPEASKTLHKEEGATSHIPPPDTNKQHPGTVPPKK